MTAIERIDAEIATLEARIAGLRYARGVVEPDGNDVTPATKSPEQPAKKSPPPVAPSRPEAGKARRSTIERRQAIAKFLAKSGPQSMCKIEVEVGAVPATVRTDLTQSGLFQKTDPTNRMSPWTLTESGRKLAESNAPG